MKKTILSVLVFITIFLTGCASISGNSEKGTYSDTTKALGAGAVVTGVGLIAIPFLGPLLAGAALWSASGDEAKANAKLNDKCIAFYEQADKRKWSQAKTRAESIKVGCQNSK